MRGFKLDREGYLALYVPKGATKVSDKESDAVAYLYTTNMGPNGEVRYGAAIFFGKQSKPVAQYRWVKEEARTKYIAGTFASRREHVGRKAKAREEKKNFVHDYKVGDVFYTSWGYDQTNVDYYEVIDVRGKMLTVVKIAAESRDTGYMTGDSRPLPGQHLTGRHAETFRVMAQKGSIKIDGHYAHRTDPSEWHRWSSYA